ncbi:MAG: type VI secretion system tube protein Hcp [Pseudomonadota bacterium]|nr:type VI secretion system tube protein Hcp [Pseudomonadota bacterium]
MSSDGYPAAVSGSDIFLHVKTKRAGKIKGESRTDKHVDDIEVMAWHWGVEAGSAIGSGAATSRRHYKSLVVEKRIDAASTGLLSALATNDEIKEAVLTLRKAGGSALDYYKMTIANARVIGIDVAVDCAGGPTETVTMAYTKIDIQYVSQTAAGGNAATTSFNDELLPS